MPRKRVAPPASAYTILVVDDQEETLASTRHLLERQGHRVLTAASGAEALDILARETVHVALVDYFMPRMTGEELVAHIRDRDPGVQVILQTGYAGEKPPLEMLRRLDIHGYHDKAEGPEKLLLWVDVALRAYAQLRRVTEAERVKSEILANISHEFRTPLHIILGYADMLLDGACGDPSPEGGETLHRLRQSAAVLLDLINDFLDMSRLEAGEVGVQLRPVHVTELREDLERAAAGLLHERPVRFHWQVNGVPAVSADRTKLRVILFNLLVNAAKFTPSGEISIDGGCDGDRVWIAVRDTGIGIDPREHADIFESFRQSDAARVGGTGLGLTIARRYAALMGGDLDVSSELGAGSVFTLRLQRAEEQATSTMSFGALAS